MWKLGSDGPVLNCRTGFDGDDTDRSGPLD